MIGGSGYQLVEENIEGGLGAGIGKAVSDPLGLAGLQASRGTVGPVTKGFDRLHHLGPCLRGHQVWGVEDVGNRRYRDAGPITHIPDCLAHRSLLKRFNLN